MHRLLTGVLALGFSAAAQNDFRWSGKLAGGQTVEIKGVNGDVVAGAAAGSEVEVTAVKKGRRSDPAAVKIDVVEHAGGVTVCAVYPSPDADKPNECKPGSAGRMNTRDNDVRVHFSVRVPAGVNFTGRTVNGKVEANSLSGEVAARTVNGDVRIAGVGHAEATTVNGVIHASIARSAAVTRPMAFKTVNGGITVELPRDARAEVEAKTVNGGIETDFPLTVQGRHVNRRLSGTIGGGGPRLTMETVNGGIHLKSAGGRQRSI